jgi:threonyl-tRNA synthetase
MNSVHSPGSPIFLPNGTRIFSRLVDFLRKQYTYYGFDEVITPTIYKKSLWAKSGHLENYADDMYSVSGKPRALAPSTSCCGTETTDAEKPAQTHHGKDEDADAEYGLKPMNCPGHCLIFASQTRSYRDLPIRYADFSSLHRNEISGALSGLTRVRRFHQDDGHIFCRPCQVEDEIKKTIDFVKVVYTVLRLPNYRFVLSTRPVEHYIGNTEEWNRAEGALKAALDASQIEWTLSEGDGAFYGPKIDIILKDSDGKEHQTATIQLDFQLPKRFGLEYIAPAPEKEAAGIPTDDAKELEDYGPVTPVLIHRAVLGSVERLMALLIEDGKGNWPFWLNPRQAAILTVNDTAPVVEWANQVRDTLVGRHEDWYAGVRKGEPLAQLPARSPTGFVVDVDDSPRTLQLKLREARQKGYGVVIVVGPHNLQRGDVSTGGENLAPQAMLEKMLHMRNTFQ